MADLEEKIKNISRMSLTDYIRHLNQEENEKMKNEDIADNESTIEEAIEKIIKLKSMKIGYSLNFKGLIIIK